MLKVSVVGATGYTGEELLKILSNHPQVEISSVSAKIDKPTALDELYPYFKGQLNLICKNYEPGEVKAAELVFLAVPHSVAMELAPPLLKEGKVIIDLSADFRLKDPSLYPKHYHFTHKAPEFLAKAVYGLPELYKEEIKKATLIANPGCFPTSVILGLLPFTQEKLIDKSANIFIDAKTGFSGAGREKVIKSVKADIEENVKAYKVAQHQHQVEMEQILKEVFGKESPLIFVPHLIPIERGILSAIYLTLKENKEEKEVFSLFKNFFKDKPFVQVLDLNKFPETKFVRTTNFCQIGIRSLGKIVIIITAIDNLVKGAAGQAVQNMNIRFGFPESMGLD